MRTGLGSGDRQPEASPDQQLILSPDAKLDLSLLYRQMALGTKSLAGCVYGKVPARE